MSCTKVVLARPPHRRQRQRRHLLRLRRGARRVRRSRYTRACLLAPPTALQTCRERKVRQVEAPARCAMGNCITRPLSISALQAHAENCLQAARDRSRWIFRGGGHAERNRVRQRGQRYVTSALPSNAVKFPTPPKPGNRSCSNSRIAAASGFKADVVGRSSGARFASGCAACRPGMNDEISMSL